MFITRTSNVTFQVIVQYHLWPSLLSLSLTELLFSPAPTKMPKEILELAWGLFFKVYGKCLYRFYSCFWLFRPDLACHPPSWEDSHAPLNPLFLFSKSVSMSTVNTYAPSFVNPFTDCLRHNWHRELAQQSSTICWREWQKAGSVPGTTNSHYLFQEL